jgi:hypothetical protein
MPRKGGREVGKREGVWSVEIGIVISKELAFVSGRRQWPRVINRSPANPPVAPQWKNVIHIGILIESQKVGSSKDLQKSVIVCQRSQRSAVVRHSTSA